MSQLRQHRGEFERRDVDIAVVTFEDDTLARGYVAEAHLDWPLLVDRDRTVYAEYGMDRAGWWQVWGPRSLAPYVRDLLRGRLPHWPTDDVRQRGGDVLIDAQGRVALQHVGVTSVDRPTVAALLAVVDRDRP